MYESDEVFQLAAALDPRFKLDSFVHANVSSITEKLSEECLKILHQSSQVSVSPLSKIQTLEKAGSYSFPLQIKSDRDIVHVNSVKQQLTLMKRVQTSH